MGLSASQARFLQLTARRGDIEYEAQQINFQRLQLSEKLSAASQKYENATTNRKMVFSFNTGSEVQKVDLSYTNYKNYMNQQLEGLSTSQEKYYLVSSSGKKLVVSSEEERDEMIEKFTSRIPIQDIQSAKEQYSQAQQDDTTSNLSSYIVSLAKIDLSSYESQVIQDDDGNSVEYYVQRQFSEKDFLIADDLDDVENFQSAIQNGTYYFAAFKENSETGERELRTLGWDTLGGGAISEDYDKSDDAQAEAEYKAIQDKVQTADKKLEMRLDQLETDREAIQTEMDSVKKVMEDNIESTFKIFS